MTIEYLLSGSSCLFKVWRMARTQGTTKEKETSKFVRKLLKLDNSSIFVFYIQLFCHIFLIFKNNIFKMQSLDTYSYQYIFLLLFLPNILLYEFSNLYGNCTNTLCSYIVTNKTVPYLRFISFRSQFTSLRVNQQPNDFFLKTKNLFQKHQERCSCSSPSSSSSAARTILRLRPTRRISQTTSWTPNDSTAIPNDTAAWKRRRRKRWPSGPSAS